MAHRTTWLRSDLSLFVISTSAAEADDIVHSLLPAADDSNGKVTTNNCEYTCNADGSVTFTVTGAGASVNVVYAEGATVWAGDAFNAKEGAYFVVDYGSADGATLGQSTQAHYTRKDKEAAGTVADLWLTSMEGADYAQYQKAKGDGYVIWDIGTYISSSDSKVFDDGMHRFTSLELYIEGSVGSSVTVYRFYVGTADAVEGIGTVRPEAKVPDEPEESETPAIEVEIPEGAVNLGRSPVNTSIVAGSTTVISDPSIMQNYNVKWTSCALLRPTETEGEYSVVAVQWLNGDGEFLFADAEEGDIVLSVHGDETVEGSQANRDALDTLVAGDIVTVLGYDFEMLTAADDAVVFFVPNTGSESDDSSEPADESEEPSDESAPADESKPADESAPVVDNSEAAGEDEGGNTGLIIGIVVGVVAVVAIVVVVIVIVKKKK